MSLITFLLHSTSINFFSGDYTLFFFSLLPFFPVHHNAQPSAGWCGMPTTNTPKGESRHKRRIPRQTCRSDTERSEEAEDGRGCRHLLRWRSVAMGTPDGPGRSGQRSPVIERQREWRDRHSVGLDGQWHLWSDSDKPLELPYKVGDKNSRNLSFKNRKHIFNGNDYCFLTKVWLFETQNKIPQNRKSIHNSLKI